MEAGLLPLEFRDIVVEFQDRLRPLLLVALQRPPAGHHRLSSICLVVHELTLPAAGAQQLRVDFIKRRRENRLQQLVSIHLADHFRCRPPVEFLGAAVPVGDDILHVTHENAVVREIEEVGLLPYFGLDSPAFRDFVFEFQDRLVAGVAKIALDTLAKSYKKNNDNRPCHENEKVGQISARNLQGVKGLCNEEGEARRR